MPVFETEDHCNIYYETYAFESLNPVVVFLNGTMQTTLHWKPNALALRHQYRVVLYDARAQGQSNTGNRPISLQTHVDDLSGLLRHLAIEKASLVGISHGAHIALAFAALTSETVDKLVLCSVGATPTCRARMILKSWFEILKRSDLETMAWTSLPMVFSEDYLKKKQHILPMVVRSIVKRNKKEFLMDQFQVMQGYDRPSEWASRVKCPTLVISGSDDPLVTKPGAASLARQCRGQHNHVNGVGHSVPAEKPEWFNHTLLQFLGTKI